MRAILTAALILTAPVLSAPAALACGGDFRAFVDGLRAEAAAAGHPQSAIDRFFQGVQRDERVIRADRSQGIFRRDFIDFSRALISQSRLQNGRGHAQRHAAAYDRAEAEFGVSRWILLSFMAFETDYGAVQGDYNTRNALVTLAHDCRRPDLFRPHVLAAVALTHRGDFYPARTQGAWAGEIGMLQMLPADILTRGRDGDGDGHVDLKGSAPDAILSGANMLRGLGWRTDEPWLQEITVPETLDWAQTGLDTARPVADWAADGVRARDGDLLRPDLPASVLIPMGRKGPAFLVYPNFSVLFEWNRSLTYVTTAAYFATRLAGAPVYDAGAPEAGLTGDQMVALQKRLLARGHDVGGIDGILGALTRRAVQAEQRRLGLPADAWPTRDLLNQL